ncbi:MAG: glutamate--tRNA ligase [Patescibacteria group bacterium]
MQIVRTRIAPSPTGEDLHIGSVYMALFNYVFAKKNKGQFIVRIEDTDRERFVRGAEEKMLNSLNWVGITSDEDVRKGGKYAPYRQSERLPIYKKHALELIEKNVAYYCFCTGQRLTRMREELVLRHLPPMYDGLCKSISKEKALELTKTQSYVIRLDVPDTGETAFTDLVRGEIKFENKLIDDQVLLKSDGYPTYHLAVVVDDHLMDISHIIRGEEWISSTPKHILLYRSLGWELPQFAHLPLLRNPDKSKLSKRKNPVWVSWYRSEGLLPEAILNYLGTLTWSMPDGRDLFSIKDMIKYFDLASIKTTAPVFDVVKLKWFNKQYLMQIPITDAVSKLKELSVYKDKTDFNNFIEKIWPLVAPRIHAWREFDEMSAFFFSRPQELERPLNISWVKILADSFKGTTWNKDDLEKKVRLIAEKEGIKPRNLFMELRVAITGKTVGPPILESCEILGKTEVIRRLEYK